MDFSMTVADEHVERENALRKVDALMDRQRLAAVPVPGAAMQV